jgi:predicted amino acid dehydrogenase
MGEVVMLLHSTASSTDEILPNLERALAQAILEAMRHERAQGASVSASGTEQRHEKGA